MDDPLFLETVAWRTGLDEAHTRRAVLATLRALGGYLGAPARRALEGALPATAREGLLRARALPGRQRTRSGFVSCVAMYEGVRAGFALEHAGVVCGVLAEALPPPALKVLQGGLPAEVGALLVPRHQDPSELAPPPAAPHPRHPSARPGTLASGRPGSLHPVCEAIPDRVQAGRGDQRAP